MSDDQVLPYGGASDPNSGFSGSDTSEERARHLDNTGTTGRRQALILAHLARVGERGVTWREVADIFGIHHGSASGALSNLHKAERIARLIQRRGRSRIYVLPEYVNGRPTDRAKPNPRDPYFDQVLPSLSVLAVCTTHGKNPNPWCSTCQAVEVVIRTIRRYQREVQAQ